MRRNWPTIAIGVLVLGALAASAVAEDLQPPWWRGQISTTSQVWEFLPGAVTPVPGVMIPPDGPALGGQPPLASTHVIWTPGPQPPLDVWLEQDRPFEYEPGKVVGIGVIPLSGRIDVTVDNHNPPNDKKLIVVQLTWRPQDDGEVPIFVEIYPQPVGTVEAVEIALGDPQDPLHWRETTYSWELDFNPPDEFFAIEGTINVDELVIDTWCIPEPATLSLLALGGLAMLRRRRV